MELEAEEKEISVEDVHELTVDLSKQCLKRIERASNDQKQAVALLLNDNEIQRLDNLDSYSSLKKLSLVNNQLIRMYGVSSLVHLEILDISHNALVTIEGLKDLKELKILNLARNRIKTIEHLNTNLKLETLNLSENSIAHISDLSLLDNLKELDLHGNRISYLRQCEKNLPDNLEVLKLDNNAVCDLNEISYLVNLTSLKELSFEGNPCVKFGDDQKFNYRPFIKNWCSSLIILDNCLLDDIECLKAEWLYSQGRGRSFRPGEHAALAEYLTTVCPKKAEQNGEFEDVKKLKLILSKAQQHQQQLREQLSAGRSNSVELFKSPVTKKKSGGIPERMVSSFQDPLSKDFRYSPDLMTRSLDSAMLRNSPPLKNMQPDAVPLQATSTFIPIPDSLISPEVCHSIHPFVSTPQRPSSISSRTSLSSSRNSSRSTPENQRKAFTQISGRQSGSSSPLASRKSGKINSRSSTPLRSSSRNTSSPVGRGNSERKKNYRETSEEEDSEILKVLPIPQRTSQRKPTKRSGNKKLEEKENYGDVKSESIEKTLKNSEAWKAAVCIQRRWRGYRARNLNGEVLSACKDLQINRMQDYITKVVSEMETTRLALEGNRKLQVLQMQAINALWKKMTTLQPNNAVENVKENKVSLQNLMETCSNLNKQVEGLQAMMKAMQGSSNSTSSIPIATQTEIVAVHTPQGEGREIFPYNPKPKSNYLLETHSSGDFGLCESKSDGNSIQDGFGNPESDSTSKTPKTVQELYSNLVIKDLSNEEVLSSASGTLEQVGKVLLNDCLVKPSLKLSESISSTEKFEEAVEFQNESNS